MQTDKRAIAHDDILKLKNTELKPDSFLSIVRDVFLFCFYAVGMPFVDVAFLRKSQINNGVLVYYRHKTGQRVSIRLEPCMQEIIDKYSSRHWEYVFPLLKSTDFRQAYHEYRSLISHYNYSLKILAKCAGIKANITSYVPRHSWASIAYRSNVGLPVISKGLGHRNPQNTLTYINQINDDRLNEANRRILSEVLDSSFEQSITKSCR